MLHRVVVSFDAQSAHDGVPDDKQDELDIEEDSDGELVDNDFQPEMANPVNTDPPGYRQTIMQHHADKLLQDQTAAQIIDTVGYATFICPVCRDIFNHTFPLYLFYRHLNSLSIGTTSRVMVSCANSIVDEAFQTNITDSCITTTAVSHQCKS